jgi:hypothetical protein
VQNGNANLVIQLPKMETGLGDGVANFGNCFA